MKLLNTGTGFYHGFRVSGLRMLYPGAIGGHWDYKENGNYYNGVVWGLGFMDLGLGGTRGLGFKVLQVQGSLGSGLKVYGTGA